MSNYQFVSYYSNPEIARALMSMGTAQVETG
jgi:hypothetical protein